MLNNYLDLKSRRAYLVALQTEHHTFGTSWFQVVIPVLTISVGLLALAALMILNLFP